MQENQQITMHSPNHQSRLRDSVELMNKLRTVLRKRKKKKNRRRRSSSSSKNCNLSLK